MSVKAKNEYDAWPRQRPGFCFNPSQNHPSFNPWDGWRLFSAREEAAGFSPWSFTAADKRAIMKEKSVVLDRETLNRSIVRMAHEIIERNKGTENLCLVGIRTRGVFLANRIAENIKKIEGKEVPVGTLDITLYRDDLTLIAFQPVVHKTEINFDISGKI